MIDDGCMIWFSYNTSRIYWTAPDKTYDFSPYEFVLDSPDKTLLDHNTKCEKISEESGNWSVCTITVYVDR